MLTIPSDAIAAPEDTASGPSGLLAGVALVIGGIGVATTMIVSVLERHHRHRSGTLPTAVHSQTQGWPIVVPVWISAAET